MAEAVLAAGSGESLVRVGKRVYVGNLAWKSSWQDLKDKFRECGNVVYANVMRDESDGRSKGWGIVEYETPQEAVSAINALNGAELRGRRLLVREDREDRDVKGRAEGTEGDSAPGPAVAQLAGSSGRTAGRGRGRAAEGAGRGRSGELGGRTAAPGRGGRGRGEESNDLQSAV